MDTKILSIDPGKASGVVTYRPGNLHHVDLTRLQLETFISLQRDVDEMVIEDFRLYPWKSQQQAFSTMETAKIIGMLEFICRMRRIRCTLQPASVKKMVTGTMATLVLGNALPDTKGWSRHSKDALLHLVAYLAKNAS